MANESFEQAGAATLAMSALHAILQRPAADAVAVLSPDGRVLEWSAEAEARTGLAEDEIIGRNVDALSPPESAREVEASLAHARAAGEDERVLLVFRPDGQRERARIVLRALRDDGELRGFVRSERAVGDERSQAERALREIEDILESLSDAFFAFDRGCRVRYVNREGEALVGRPRDVLLGRSFHELDLGVLSRSRMPKECRELSTTRTAREWEERDAQSGRSFSFTANPTRDGFVVYVRDVTELRRATADQRMLGELIESTPDIVVSADREGRAVYLNGAGRSALGLGARESLGQVTLGSFHPPETARRLLDEGVPAALRDGSWMTDAEVLTHDGHRLPVSALVLAHRDRDGALLGLSAFLRDISVRHSIEERQRFLSEATRQLVGSLEYDETLRAAATIAVPSLADLVVLYAEDGGQVRIVATAHRDPLRAKVLRTLEGTEMCSPGPVGARAALETGEPELVSSVTEAWAWAATGHESGYGAFRHSGLRSAVTVPLVARGRRRGALLFGRVEGQPPFVLEDVPSLLELGARAALAIDNASLYHTALRATAARDEVLRVVSHDLRNPVAAILLAAGALERSMRGDEAHEKDRTQTETIRRSAERASRLIDDLLDAARLDAGRLTLELTDVAPKDVIEEVLELHRPLADERGLQLASQVDDGVGVMCADPHRLLQVLGNLVGNAIKVTPSGGHIDVQAARDGDNVVFSVRDTGPGIPEDELPHLFDRFWQGRKRSGGAGLGLAIVKAIVEAHHGRWWVDSTPGAGATFFVAFPLANASRESPSASLH